MRDIAMFAAQANVSTLSICGGSLQSLLTAVLAEGWRARNVRNDRSYPPPDRALKAATQDMIPHLPAASLNKALGEAFAEFRRDLFFHYARHGFVGLSLDGVTVGYRKFLNFDVIHPSSSTQPFTYRFDEHQDAMQTGDSAKCLFTGLETLENDGFHVAGITSDGCSFQKKRFS
jgi:hypothetical protein